ncbi:MAG TPA: NADH:ubiquinone oxidoreductase [Candidatus Aenigmarchaeota archaeon]|nr:MAG: NADH:ubiquinone oxidoreductase [Candidatus Aenigmarchaeota archaeon]HDD46405.1 NADH:ubiquinone oxidoreductase [Candidatus Aenigmarchaeota archaeon]
MFIIEHLPALVIAIPLLAAFIAPLLKRFGKHAVSVWSILNLSIVECLVIVLGYRVIKDGIQSYAIGASIPSLLSPNGLPVRIILEVDAISSFMGLTSISIILLACIYSACFMKKYKSVERYYSLLLLMAAGIMGMAFTGDMFNMFVFLEVLSISSAGLIAFYAYKGEAIEAAFKYLVISSISALMVLFAIALLYGQYGLLNIAALGAAFRFTILDKIALALLVSAFVMKCGAVPLHMWVADAYGEAPAPISASLVVASQISLYALFRICFTLFGLLPAIQIIAWFIILFGLASMFVGVTMAMPQKDIKRLMAYHAISQTGYMLLGVGVGLAVINDINALNAFGIAAMEGGIFHIINHAMYKGLLFLVAGAIIYRTGTKNLNEMGGLGNRMPITAVLFLIGMLSITGLPPFNGFASKLIIYESVFLFNPILSVVAMIVSILTLASFVKVFYSAFTGQEQSKYKDVKEIPAIMLVPLLILAFLIILFGLFPGIILKLLVKPAVQALLDRAGYIGVVV